MDLNDWILLVSQVLNGWMEKGLCLYGLLTADRIYKQSYFFDTQLLMPKMRNKYFEKIVENLIKTVSKFRYSLEAL